jgi:hypothetical protein
MFLKLATKQSPGLNVCVKAMTVDSISGVDSTAAAAA